MATTETYRRFVLRIWDQLQRRTGHTVFYFDERHILAYCPACLDGTLCVGFVQHPRPGFTIASGAHGSGRCSRGCTEREVAQALA